MPARASPRRDCSVLIRRSAGDDVLAERLGERKEIPAHLFLRLLSVASERVRVKLRASHPQAGGEIDRVVEEVTDRMKAQAVARPRDYADRVQELGDRYIAGRLNENDLAKFAHGGRLEDTVVTLALLAKVPVPVVDRAMQSERSDIILVIARTVGLKWATHQADPAAVGGAEDPAARGDAAQLWRPSSSSTRRPPPISFKFQAMPAPGRATKRS